MRTTFTLDDDVAAAVEVLRRQDGIGISEAVNRLVRAGLSRQQPRQPYVHQSAALGVKVDVANIGDVLELLDEAD